MAGAPRGNSAQGRLIVLSGPSGVGKGTVVEAALQANPKLWLSVSVTTRPRREGEVDGAHYWFVTSEYFDRLLANDGLLEWATFAGYRYGTPSEPVRAQLAAGRSALLEIDLEGARQVRAAFPDALLVFLAPPSFEVLESRLRGRGTEDDAAVSRRLARARTELAAAAEFDVVIINDDASHAAGALLDLLAAVPGTRPTS